MTDRQIIAVVLPEGYRGGSDFAKDCNVEVIGTCNESVFRKAVHLPEILAALNAAINWYTPPNDSGPFPAKQIANAINKVRD